MKSAFDAGLNRTGIATSPIEAPKTIHGAEQGRALEPEGAPAELRELQLREAKEAMPLGHVPPPLSMKGVAKAAIKALEGDKANVFIDKLGERLAFERVGTRLYETVLLKARAYPSWEGGPTVEQLVEHREEELEHFGLLMKCLEMLGADPTAMTPSADLVQNLSKGLPAVLGDPRTDLRQCLEGLLVAELADNACWEMLIPLAREMAQEEMAALFERALGEEQEHLTRVQAWVSAGTLAALHRELPMKGAPEAEAPA